MNSMRKYKVAIMSITVVAGAAALIFSFVRPVYFDTSISFSINRINQQTTQDYQFDGYYAIQASDLFSQTVMSWFMTPSVLLEIYGQAGIDPDISSIEEISSRFRTRKYSPQNIVVQYQERDHATADKIAQAIISTVEEKSTAANQTSDQQAFFEVVGATPVIVENKPDPIINTAIGLVAGFIIATVAVYFIEYWKRPERDLG